jgi:hypothetical protein
MINVIIVDAIANIDETGREYRYRVVLQSNSILASSRRRHWGAAAATAVELKRPRAK